MFGRRELETIMPEEVREHPIQGITWETSVQMIVHTKVRYQFKDSPPIYAKKQKKGRSTINLNRYGKEMQFHETFVQKPMTSDGNKCFKKDNILLQIAQI